MHRVQLTWVVCVFVHETKKALYIVITAHGEFSWDWESLFHSGLRVRENLRIKSMVVLVTEQQLRLPLPLYKECCLVLSFIMSIFQRLVVID